MAARALIVTLALCASNVATAASIRFVGKGAGCNYPTIQAAVNAAASGDSLYISNNPTTYSEHVSITGKSLTLSGTSATDCKLIIAQQAESATGPTVDGGNAGVVFTIRGTSTVSMTNLAISGANNGGGDGGGISYSGVGTLTLSGVSVIDNKAGYGAGINLKGDGGHAELHIKNNTLVFGNIASTSGGGVRLEGDARLIMVGTNASISGNNASDSGYGGGIEIIGPARADITGYGLSPIAANSAGNGGGIAVIDNGNGAAVLRTFGYGPTQTPALINGNSATHFGGGIYLENHASACLYATRVDGNDSPDGAAIFKYDFSNSNEGAYINGGQPAALGDECGPESIESLGGASTCTAGAECSTIDNNTGGSVLYLVVADFIGTRFRMQGNQSAESTVRGDFRANRCLLTDNQAGEALINGDYGGKHAITSCTIANNTIGGGFVLEMLEDVGVTLTFDIIDTLGKSTLHRSSGASYLPVVGNILATEIDTLAATTNPSVMFGYSTFVDAAHRDYHLSPVAQIALDFSYTTDNFDLDGRRTDVDLPTITNRFGIGDLGAFERMNLFDDCGNDYDTLFCAGFEHNF